GLGLGKGCLPGKRNPNKILGVPARLEVDSRTHVKLSSWVLYCPHHRENHRIVNTSSLKLFQQIGRCIEVSRRAVNFRNQNLRWKPSLQHVEHILIAKRPSTALWLCVAVIPVARFRASGVYAGTSPARAARRASTLMCMLLGS